MIPFARRASAILYNLLRSRGDARPYLLPANACPVLPETFRAAQQAFDLVDAAEPRLEIDRDLCLAALRQRPNAYAGILFVRSYGNECDPTAFFEELRTVQPDIFVIDDKCLCRPDAEGRTLSAAADATLFSTGRAKYVDLGGGGFAFLRSHIAYHQEQQCVADWLDFGEPETSWSEYRRRTEEATLAADRQKAALNAIYAAGLPSDVQFHAELQQWRFNIRVRRSDRLIAALFKAGLASRHYPSLGGTYGAGVFPVAEHVHAEIVNLFNDRYFDEDRARLAVQVIRAHLTTALD